MTTFDVIGLAIVAIMTAGLLATVRFRRWFSYPLRVIPEIDLLKEAIQDAVEGGKRIHLGLGRGSFTQADGAASLQGLAFQRELICHVSTVDLPPTVSSGDATVAWVSAEVLASAYSGIGVADYTSPQSAYFVGGTPLATAAGVLPEIFDRRTRAGVLGGHWGSEALFLLEAGAANQKIPLAGSDDLAGQAVFFAGSRGALLGDEWFAAAAYLRSVSAQPTRARAEASAAGLALLDAFRWATVVLVLAGVAARLVGWL